MYFAPFAFITFWFGKKVAFLNINKVSFSSVSVENINLV